MTPKEKAEELFNKFYSSKHRPSMSRARQAHAKECALIAVNEILDFTKQPQFPMGITFGNGYDYDGYWIDVKIEIEMM